MPNTTELSTEDCHTKSESHEHSSLESLCLGGGGARGLCYIGLIKYLEDSGRYNEVKKIVGSSIGGVFGVLIAQRRSVDTILRDAMTNSVPAVGLSVNVLSNLYYLLTKYGIMEKSVLEGLISTVCGETVTFAEFHAKWGVEVTIVGTNISKRRIEYFNHQLTPDMRVSTALRITTAVPIIFPPIEYKCNLYADPCIVYNTPTLYYSDTPGLAITLGGNDCLSGYPIKSLLQYVANVCYSVIDARPAFPVNKKLLEFKNTGVGIFDTDLSECTVNSMIALGYETMSNAYGHLPKVGATVKLSGHKLIAKLQADLDKKKYELKTVKADQTSLETLLSTTEAEHKTKVDGVANVLSAVNDAKDAVDVVQKSLSELKKYKKEICDALCTHSGKSADEFRTFMSVGKNQFTSPSLDGSSVFTQDTTKVQQKEGELPSGYFGKILTILIALKSTLDDQLMHRLKEHKDANVRYAEARRALRNVTLKITSFKCTLKTTMISVKKCTSDVAKTEQTLKETIVVHKKVKCSDVCVSGDGESEVCRKVEKACPSSPSSPSSSSSSSFSSSVEDEDEDEEEEEEGGNVVCSR